MSECANTVYMGCSSVTESVTQPITVSIVSHGQGALVSSLLDDLARCGGVSSVILTQNIPEAEIACPESLLPRLRLVRNGCPIGFAANHNQAFRLCRTPLFAVLNPDIRLVKDPFLPLIDTLLDNNCALVAPVVCNPEGLMEDNARYFPTPARLLAKLLKLEDGCYPVSGKAPLCVDWTAGMFLLFRAEAFCDIGGFDEGFFLYYEDVDICVRLWKAFKKVMVHPGVSVTHAAQRASRRRPRYLAWHLSSMFRYFCKHFGRLPRNGRGS